MHDAQDEVRCAALPALEATLHLLALPCTAQHDPITARGQAEQGGPACAAAIQSMLQAQDVSGHFLGLWQASLGRVRDAYPGVFEAAKSWVGASASVPDIGTLVVQ